MPRLVVLAHSWGFTLLSGDWASGPNLVLNSTVSVPGVVMPEVSLLSVWTGGSLEPFHAARAKAHRALVFSDGLRF